MARLIFEQDFIVGGSASTPITPNFRVREFADAAGRIRIHRELVAALQVLRNVLGQSLSIESQSPSNGLGNGIEGRFVWVGGNDPAAIAEAARRLIREAWFARVETAGTAVYLEMPDPARPPPIAAELALDRAIQVTAGFETQGDPYQQVTGNFDGAGLSFGPLQFNFGTGTLQPLFQLYEQRDAAALQTCFGALWPEWQRTMRLSIPRQVSWADALSRGRNRAGFDPAWTAALQAVGRVPAFRHETLRRTYDTYGRKLIATLFWLKGLTPLPIRNFRALAALFDVCVQQGGLDKAHAQIRARVLAEKPSTDLDLVRIAVVERGLKALPQWRADAISRRLCILDREPVKVSQDGHSATRDNRNLFLVRNAAVTQLEKYLT